MTKKKSVFSNIFYTTQEALRKSGAIGLGNAPEEFSNLQLLRSVFDIPPIGLMLRAVRGAIDIALEVTYSAEEQSYFLRDSVSTGATGMESI